MKKIISLLAVAVCCFFLATPAQAQFASKDFENFYQEALDGFNNGYRIYMQNLFGKEIAYQGLPLSEGSSKKIDAVLHTAV